MRYGLNINIINKMKTFSQYYQDSFLNFLFAGKQGGVFLDIGANDGITFSNTYFFEKYKGWSGLCVEPLVDKFQKCKTVRNCHLENVCLSDREGVVRFRKVYGFDMLSGIVDFMDEAAIARIEELTDHHNAHYDDIEVPSLKLGTLLRKYGMSKMDFCSIDVEGAEWAIVQTLDWSKIDIDAFVVEGNDRNVRRLLEEKGYRRIKSECDCYFIKEAVFGKARSRMFRFMVWCYLFHWKVRRRIIHRLRRWGVRI